MSKKEKKEFKVKGKKLLKTIEDLIHEGNIRRIIIKNDKGHTFLEIPLTLGFVGMIAAPVWVAVAAIAGAANKFTIEVEKRDGATQTVEVTEVEEEEVE